MSMVLDSVHTYASNGRARDLCCASGILFYHVAGQGYDQIERCRAQHTYVSARECISSGALMCIQLNRAAKPVFRHILVYVHMHRILEVYMIFRAIIHIVRIVSERNYVYTVWPRALSLVHMTRLYAHSCCVQNRM